MISRARQEMQERRKIRPPPGFPPKEQDDNQALITPGLLKEGVSLESTTTHGSLQCKHAVPNMLFTLAGSTSSYAFTNSCKVILPTTHSQTGSSPFTGKEKPFVPRASLASTVVAQQVKGSSAGSNRSRSASPTIQVLQLKPSLESQKTSQQKFVPYQPLSNEIGALPKVARDKRPLECSAPLLGARRPDSPLQRLPVLLPGTLPRVNSVVPVLQPVSPRRQVQLELQAGMKPSFPSHIVLQQAAHNFCSTAGQPIIPARPIRGRIIEKELNLTGPAQGDAASIPEAHTHHKLATLAAQDSAIILPEDCNDENVLPLDLSRRSSLSGLEDKPEILTAQIASIPQLSPVQPAKLVTDANQPTNPATWKEYEQLWIQMTSANNKNTNFSETAEKKATTSKSETMSTSVSPTEPNAALKIKHFGTSVDNTNSGKEAHTGTQEKSNLVQMENTRKSPERCPESGNPALEGTAGGIEEQNMKSKAENGSKCSELINVPRDEISAASEACVDNTSSVPLDLSSKMNFRQETASSTPSDNIPQNGRGEEWSPVSLEVRGRGILSSRSDGCVNSSPIETPDGLVDDVYEEDLVTDANNTDVDNSSHGSSSYSSSSSGRSGSFHLHGNNIWMEKEESTTSGNENSCTPRSEKSWVSDSEGEECYSLHLNSKKTPVSPVLVSQKTNSFVRDTSSRLLNMLHHCAGADLKALLADFIHHVQQETNTNDVNNNNNEFSRDEMSIKEAVLNCMHQMIKTSNKLERILKLPAALGGDAHLPRSTLNRAVSAAQSYQKSTNICMKRLGRIIFKKPANTKAKANGNNQTMRPGRKPKEKEQKTEDETVEKVKLIKTKDLTKSSLVTPRKLLDKLQSHKVPKCKEPETRAIVEERREEPEKAEDASPEVTCTLRQKHESSPEKIEEKTPESVDNFQGLRSLAAVDLVTSTPIDGNRYWKKRMIHQKSHLLGNVEPPSEVPPAATPKTPKSVDRKSVPECERGLLSASFSDDNDSTTTYDSKLVWTPCCKSLPKLKIRSAPRKQSDKKSPQPCCSYKRLKEYERKPKKPKRKKKCNDKRKRNSKGSPNSISLSSTHTPKKTKKSTSPDNIVGPVVSSNRRHFPYQNQCNRLIDSVYNRPASCPFREEYQNNEEPEYYKVVTYPMFFEYITSKLRQRLYYQLDDFVSDVRRVFWNTRLFFQQYRGQTSETCPTLRDCDLVEAFFENRLKSTFPFMDFSSITGSPQAGKIKTTTSETQGDDTDLNFLKGNKVKGAINELWK